MMYEEQKSPSPDSRTADYARTLREDRMRLCAERGLPVNQGCALQSEPPPVMWAWRRWLDPNTPGEWITGPDEPAVMPGAPYEVVQLGAVRHVVEPQFPAADPPSIVPLVVERLAAVLYRHPELQPVCSQAALLMQCVQEVLSAGPGVLQAPAEGSASH